jgi:two-component system, LuxR family, response regulator FixJ
MMDKDAVVYVIDDDTSSRDFVIGLVQSKGLKARGYGSASDFLQEYDAQLQGCVVVDAQMPEMNGLELLEELKRRKSPLAAVMFTGFADVPLAVRAMQAGAVTILEKPCGAEALWEAIEQALEVGKTQFSARKHREAIEARLATLSGEELTVLRRLIDGEPNKTIAADLDLGLRTVELRRSNVMRKMQAQSLPDLVRMAIVAGLLNAEGQG